MRMGKKVLVGVLTGILSVILLAGMPMGKDGVVIAARRTLKNPSLNSDGVMTWDCVYFGSYPQSDVTGKIKEPIKWRVLSVNGNDAFLLADQNLDTREYDKTEVYITWETCTIRSWLNGYGSGSNMYGADYRNDNFIDRAFTLPEQEAISSTTVKNADNPIYPEGKGGNDTTDKIFLLSYEESTSPIYGFLPNSQTSNSNEMNKKGITNEDKARQAINTAYAVERRAINNKYGDGMYGDWWLRSPGLNSYNAMIGYYDGSVILDGLFVNYIACAVRPALHLNLTDSNLWSYAGTVNRDGKSTECQHENIELRGRREACVKAGYTGDTYCSDCGVKLRDGETIPPNGKHQWDNGIITKQASKKADAVRTFTCTICGETRTESVKGTSDLIKIPTAVQAVTDDSLARQSSEDVKGAVFHTLLARTAKLTNKAITLKWKKVSKADGYKIYGNQCGKKNHYKLISDVGASKTSYTQKELKKGTYYKYVVSAYKVVDGKKVTIAVSKTIHATTTGGKYGVAKSVKVNKSKVTLKKGGKFTINAAEVKKDKKIKRHCKIAYESNNPRIATVSKKGVVKAKKKGSCYIYVYAQNGVYKRIKVTVK